MRESEAELDERAPGAFIFGMVAGEQRGSTEVGETEADYGPSRCFRQSAMPHFRTYVDAEFEDSRRSGVGPQPGTPQYWMPQFLAGFDLLSDPRSAARKKHHRCTW